MELGAHAHHTFRQVEASGEACRPLDFPPPLVARGVRVNALVVHAESGTRQVCSGVIHREDLNATTTATTTTATTSSSSHAHEHLPYPPPPSTATTTTTTTAAARTSASTSSRHYSPQHHQQQQQQVLAYWPQRRLQDAIYGSVWACLVLRRHYGVAADDAARAAGVEPGSPNAPLVWEITGDHVAVKMVEWSRVHHMRGRLLEDPVKEVAAMQLVGSRHPHVLGSTEVLQDGDFLYSVMPYCRGGDLFGVVVQYAEESGGEGGMPEPVARYWFRQILWGLHHLQSKGVCHRDLSLENVLVDDEYCLIIDLGMCLRVPYNDPNHNSTTSSSRGGGGGGGPTTTTTTTDVTHGTIRRLMKPQGVCGKHNYMSPEVFANVDNFDGFAIDLWAAGVILYIMLTGFPPYDQASLSDQRFHLIVTHRLVEQLQNWDIHLSTAAGDLLQQMLQLDPRDRLTLAQVMAHAWVVQGPTQPPPPPEPLPFH